MSTLQIGVDLAKSVFEVAVSAVPGQVRERRRLSRTALGTYFAARPPAEILLEACGSAHPWDRRLQQLGHQVTLLQPRGVARYRDGNKTDRADAKALLEEIRAFEAQLEAVRRALARLAEQMPAAQLLQTVPGIGVLTATPLGAPLRRLPGAHPP